VARKPCVAELARLTVATSWCTHRVAYDNPRGSWRRAPAAPWRGRLSQSERAHVQAGEVVRPLELMAFFKKAEGCSKRFYVRRHSQNDIPDSASGSDSGLPAPGAVCVRAFDTSWLSHGNSQTRVTSDVARQSGCSREDIILFRHGACRRSCQ